MEFKKVNNNHQRTLIRQYSTIHEISNFAYDKDVEFILQAARKKQPDLIKYLHNLCSKMNVAMLFPQILGIFHL